MFPKSIVNEYSDGKLEIFKGKAENNQKTLGNTMKNCFRTFCIKGWQVCIYSKFKFTNVDEKKLKKVCDCVLPKFDGCMPELLLANQVVYVEDPAQSQKKVVQNFSPFFALNKHRKTKSYMYNSRNASISLCAGTIFFCCLYKKI